ncbi:hypothetical protein [Cellulomonas sp. HZM]|uniref:hypothetical protein n=1 Tax=Cellulomonas sp. HZM TaxID=1454010 RepID=UPI000552E9B0|nr:hypothetical protein [Cellulomonas sp. HZM]
MTDAQAPRRSRYATSAGTIVSGFVIAGGSGLLALLAVAADEDGLLWAAGVVLVVGLGLLALGLHQLAVNVDLAAAAAVGVLDDEPTTDGTTVGAPAASEPA